MKINTKIFGEIEIADEKIVTFENGIIGFPEMKRFALLHDEEKGYPVKFPIYDILQAGKAGE